MKQAIKWLVYLSVGLFLGLRFPQSGLAFVIWVFVIDPILKPSEPADARSLPGSRLDSGRPS